MENRDTWNQPEDDDQSYGYHTYDDESYPEDHEDSLLYGDGEVAANPRRTQAAIAMVLAAVFFIFSLFVLATFNIGSGPLEGLFDFWSLTVWSWVLFGVMLVFLIWLLALLFSAPAPEHEDWYSDEPQEPPTAEYADEPGAPDTITLRCPKCVNIFSLQDPWTRPFYHVCPHCEARGVYTGNQDPPEVKAALERHGHSGHAV